MDTKIDIQMFKKLALYSLIFGAALAVIALIPQLMPVITLFIIPFLTAPIVLAFMIVKKELDTADTKQCAILGTASGVITGMSFLVIFYPLVLFIHLFFKSYYTYALQFLNFFLVVVLIVTVSLMYALTNAATALLTALVFSAFEKKRD